MSSPPAGGNVARVSAPTGIDRAAPVVAHHEIDIAAPADLVWRLHADVDAWPTWQAEITEAHAGDALAAGTSFRWTSHGLAVTSTVYALDEGRRVLWGGTAGGITGVHEWTFAATPGGVRVTTTESFAGAPVEADVAGMQGQLDASLVAWLGHLKAVAESRAPRSTAGA